MVTAPRMLAGHVRDSVFPFAVDREDRVGEPTGDPGPADHGDPERAHAEAGLQMGAMDPGVNLRAGFRLASTLASDVILLGILINLRRQASTPRY